MNLEAYKKALPAVNAFRLCYRFGQGPEAFVTKLPVELEQAIEQLIIDARRVKLYDDWSETDWKSEFRCFESRCEPVSHWEEMSPLWNVAEEMPRCDSCGKHSIYDNVCDNRCTEKTTDVCNVCTVNTG